MTASLPNRQITNTRDPAQRVNGGRAATKHYLKHTISASRQPQQTAFQQTLRLNREKNFYENSINHLQQKETQKAKKPHPTPKPAISIAKTSVSDKSKPAQQLRSIM